MSRILHDPTLTKSTLLSQKSTQDNKTNPRCPHPPFQTPAFDDTVQREGLTYYPFTRMEPGRTSGQVLQLSTLDMTSIRSVKAPPIGDPTLIAVCRQYKTWKWDKARNEWYVSGERKSTHPFGFYTATFDQIVEVTRVLRETAPEELSLFGIMLQGQPQHLILDIDGKVANWPHLVGRVDEVEAETRAVFVEFFKATFGSTPDMALWTREDSTNSDKISFHINHSGVAFASTRDLFEFVLRWVAWLQRERRQSLLLHPTTGESLIDLTIYTANRPMRLVYSRKVDGTPLIPSPEADGIIETRELLWRSLVCCSMPADPSKWLAFQQYLHTDVNGKRLCSTKKRGRENTTPIAPEGQSMHKWLKRKTA